MKPLPGALSFLKRLRHKSQVLILSDTFYEFAQPLIKQLDYPVLFCNWLKVDRKGFISGYKLRQKDGKRKAVLALKQIGFKVIAAGDYYNDLTMLRSANGGVLFRPPANIRKKVKQFPVSYEYGRLFNQLTRKSK